MSAKLKKNTAQTVAYDYDVVVAPVITEKSTALSEHNKVVFLVRLDANKASIKRAVESLFNVKVSAVNTLREIGKVKRFRNSIGKQSDVKKAIITLAEGQSIDLNSGAK